MKKAGVFLLTVLATILLAGLYGILHDQLTYTLSPEYFTKFKFIQFGLWDREGEALLPNPRGSVCVVGFLATWWTGIFIGLGNGLTGLIHADYKVMMRVVSKATLLCLLIAFLTGIAGLVYGRLVLAKNGVDWWLPDNLVHRDDFIAVGSMHNFSYLGGLIGLIASIGYQIIQKRKTKGIPNS